MRVPLKKQMARFISRQLLGTTLRAVSLKTNIPVNTLARLRVGEDEILSSTIDDVCTGFRCTLADIFPDEYSRSKSNGNGQQVKPGQMPVCTPFREPELPTIQPVLGFLGFIFAQIGLICRQIKVIPSQNKVIAS